jgi:hypothetical protein
VETVIFKKRTVDNMEFLNEFLSEVSESAKLKEANKLLQEKVINLTVNNLELTRLCLRKEQPR